MSSLYKLKRKLIKNPFLWKNVFNASAKSNFKAASVPNHLKPVIEEFKENGMVKTNIQTVFNDIKPFDDINEYFQILENAQDEIIQKYRNSVNDADSIGAKTFMLFLLGEKPILDKNSPAYKFASLKEIKALADAYFGMDTILKYYNFWHTVPTNTPPRESQLWHRDREDLQIFKMFLYFKDVDLGSGPFTYAPKTHLLGSIHTEPEFHLEGTTRRTTDEQMAKIVPKDKWIVSTGKVGDIVLADTHGFHKGGQATEYERLLYTCMYTSPACDREYFKTV